MKIVKLLKAMTAAAPTNDVRYQINTMYFEYAKENTGDTILCIITTGAYLIKLSLDPSIFNNEFSLGESVLFNISSVKNALKNAKVNDNITFVKNKGDFKLKISSKGEDRYCDLELCQAVFPDWRKLEIKVNSAGGKGRRYVNDYGVDARLAEKVFRVFSSVGEDYSPTTVNFTNSLTPLKFTFTKEFLPCGLKSLEAFLAPYLI